MNIIKKADRIFQLFFLRRFPIFFMSFFEFYRNFNFYTLEKLHNPLLIFVFFSIPVSFSSEFNYNPYWFCKLCLINISGVYFLRELIFEINPCAAIFFCGQNSFYLIRYILFFILIVIFYIHILISFIVILRSLYLS